MDACQNSLGSIAQTLPHNGNGAGEKLSCAKRRSVELFGRDALESQQCSQQLSSKGKSLLQQCPCRFAQVPQAALFRDTASHAQCKVAFQNGRYKGRQGLCQQTKQCQKKAACGGPGTCLTAHDQNTGIDRKKTGEKAVPAFDLRAQLPGNFKQWLPQKDPAPTGADKITPAVIPFLPQKQTDYGRQEQKQQQCGITADAFPQCLEQRRSAKTLQNAPRVFCYLQSIHRALVKIRLPRALLPAAVQTGTLCRKSCRGAQAEACSHQQKSPPLPVLHLAMLPIVCRISSSKGHAAASTRHRPASPTHHPKDSAPASSHRVRV